MVIQKDEDGQGYIGHMEEKEKCMQNFSWNR
jgi:hypothetical protein